MGGCLSSRKSFCLPNETRATLGNRKQPQVPFPVNSNGNLCRNQGSEHSQTEGRLPASLPNAEQLDESHYSAPSDEPAYDETEPAYAAPESQYEAPEPPYDEPEPQYEAPVPRPPSSVSTSSEESAGGNHLSSTVSYNKISVREPLSRVLAERAALEHQYQEVEEEQLSSFYEEIGGSTNSSVTYSKIGDVVDAPIASTSNQNGKSERQTSPPPPPSVASLHLVLEAGASSRSTSPHQRLSCNGAAAAVNSTSYQNQNGDLYAYVDKSLKTSKRTNQTEENCADNLYAKIQKNPLSNVIKISSSSATNGATSSFSSSSTSIEKQPSRPPPVPSLMNLPRASKTVSMYNSPLPSLPPTIIHQRRHSHSHPYPPEVDIEDAIEEPGYEVVGHESDNEPTYEEIGRQLSLEKD
ncbi:hypothetical protein HDE_05186 [Halotydeus destructor]|nr:hypothetical protein HDE_05186 [Halotydeus destructor]